jgi:hypothetical protein
MSTSALWRAGALLLFLAGLCPAIDGSTPTVLPTGKQFDGQIVDQVTKKPVAVAEVFYRRSYDVPGSESEIRVRTDERGIFHLPGIPFGRVQIALPGTSYTHNLDVLFSESDADQLHVFSVLAQPADAAGLPGSRIDLQTAAAVADQVVVAKVAPPTLPSGRSVYRNEFALSVVQRLKGSGEPQLEAQVFFTDSTSSEARWRSVPHEHRPEVGKEYLVFLCEERGGRPVPLRALKLVEATPSLLAEVKRLLAQTAQPRALSELLGGPTAFADQIVVGKVTGIVPESPEINAAKKITLDVTQTLKGQPEPRLVAFTQPWVPPEQSQLEPRLEIGGEYLMFLSLRTSEPPEGMTFSLTKLARPTPPQLATVGALVQKSSLVAEIILPEKISPRITKIEALLRLTNRGEQPVRVSSGGRGNGQTNATYVVSDSDGIRSIPIYLGAEHILPLEPGQWLDLPIGFYFGDKPARPVRLTASYEVLPDYATALGLPTLRVRAPAVMLEK